MDATSMHEGQTCSEHVHVWHTGGAGGPDPGDRCDCGKKVWDIPTRQIEELSVTVAEDVGIREGN